MNYTGSHEFSAGSKFWIVPSASTNVIPQCYYPAASISSMIFGGIVPDTSTSNSNSSFPRAYASGVSIFPSTTWSTGNSTQIWQLSIEGIPQQISASLVLASGGRSATFRSGTTIRTTVNASSQVTFYNRGKVIPNCRNVLSIGG